MRTAIIIAYLVGLILVACKKPETFTNDKLYTPALASGTIPADSSTVLEMSITFSDVDELDVREAHFMASGGRWLPGTDVTVTNNEVAVQADENGKATVRWIPGRLPETIAFTVWAGDARYRSSSSVSTVAAPPDTVLLTSTLATFDSTQHTAQLTATLYKNVGYHSVGLPLSFRAWHIVGGATTDIGNFTSAPLLQTTRANAYTISLDLFSSGLLPQDTVYVAAFCGTVASDTLRFVYNDQ